MATAKLSPANQARLDAAHGVSELDALRKQLAALEAQQAQSAAPAATPVTTPRKPASRKAAPVAPKVTPAIIETDPSANFMYDVDADGIVTIQFDSRQAGTLSGSGKTHIVSKAPDRFWKIPGTDLELAGFLAYRKNAK